MSGGTDSTLRENVRIGEELFRPIQPRRERGPWLHVLLFLTTVVTTVGVGGSGIGGIPFSEPFDLGNGIAFSGTLLLILGTHELGHYFAARRWFMRVSLPYFIPVPFALGTMGAFIRLRSPIPNRRVLLDVGASGPLAGFAVAVPAVIVGIYNSRVLPPMDLQGGIALGEPLVFSFLAKLILGVSSSDYTILLHPIALAGWLGLFVTALNLLPMGQLDGGHILYALLGRKQHVITLATVAVLVLLASFWLGWLVWVVIPFILGFRHPPSLDDDLPLDPRRKVLGWICMGVFAVSFTPVPFQF